MSIEHDSQHDLRTRIRNLPGITPDPGYRERARRAFLQPAAPRTTGRRRLALVAGGTALAAAAALAVALLLPGTPGWTVASFQGTGPVEVDGTPVPVSGLSSVPLVAGTRIVTGSDVELTLECGREVTLVVSENASLRLDGRGTNGDLRATVEAGTASGSTREDFPEGGFWLNTTEARVHIRGTTFAVMQESGRTCVCVLEGTVRVASRDGNDPAVEIPPGRQLFLSPGAEPRLEDLSPEQRTRLAKVRSDARTR